MWRKSSTWLLIGLFVLAVAARLIPGERIIDDAYITFRYARNLLAGHGFVYNPGQPVLGTTTPLFTFLLALLALPFGGAQANFPLIAVLVSALADGLGVVLLFKIGQRLGSPAAGLATALAWAIAPFSVTFAIGGLETSTYMLLLIALLWAYLHQRIVLAAALGAAAILTRPDAVLLVGPVLLHYFLRAQPRPWQAGFWRSNAKAITVFLLPLLAWAFFAWLYFGSPLAQSVAAKSNAYLVEPMDAFIHLLQHYGMPFVEYETFTTRWLYLGLWLYPFLSLVGTLYAVRREQRSLPFALFPWLHFIVFAVSNPLLFRWYLTPPLPFYILFIALGVQKIAADLLPRIAAPRRLAPLGALLVALPFLFNLHGWARYPDPPAARPAPKMAWQRAEEVYREAVAFIQPRLPAESQSIVVAAGDVGVLGYFLDVRILDLVGLNSKETLPYYPLDAAMYGDFVYAVPPALIRDQQPDYVVILDLYGRASLQQDADFLASYTLVQFFPREIYGPEGGLQVFQRNP